MAVVGVHVSQFFKVKCVAILNGWRITLISHFSVSLTKTAKKGLESKQNLIEEVRILFFF